MTLGPMGNDLLHSAALDATELLDVVFQWANFPKSKTGRCDGRLRAWLLMEALLEEFTHGRRHGRCAGHVIDIQQLQHSAEQ